MSVYKIAKVLELYKYDSVRLSPFSRTILAASPYIIPWIYALPSVGSRTLAYFMFVQASIPPADSMGTMFFYEKLHG